MSRKLVRISMQQTKLSDQPPGFKFGGIFEGTKTKQIMVQQEDGEIQEKTLTTFIFRNEAGNRHAYVGDKGLIQGFEDGMVNVGDELEIIKLDKAKLKGAKTMNQYDIYQVQ